MQAFKRWDGLRLEVIRYCKEKDIPESDFRFLGIYEWQNVYGRLLEKFVDGEYARGHGLYWSNIEGGLRKDMEKIYSFVVGSENYVSYEWMESLAEIVGCPWKTMPSVYHVSPFPFPAPQPLLVTLIKRGLLGKCPGDLLLDAEDAVHRIVEKKACDEYDEPDSEEQKKDDRPREEQRGYTPVEDLKQCTPKYFPKKADAEEQAVFEAHADGLLKKDDQRPVNGKNIAKRTMPRSTTAIVPKPIPWDERLNIISMKA